MPHAQIINAADLITPHEAIRDGFTSQALAKTVRAEPYVERAKQFSQALQQVTEVNGLLDLREYKPELIAAAGFSDKSRSHLSPEELDTELQRVFEAILQQAGAQFREEVLYRYLLTKGDSLGGEMRNLTGAIAQSKLAGAILKALSQRNINPDIRRSSEKIQRITWDNRLLLFDCKPALIDKNIDVILLDTVGSGNQRIQFNSSFSATQRQLLGKHENYLACGELKGGIDPAGADEHWKTAKSALDRIRERFKERRCPYLFFIGAVIAAGMADEIINDLQTERLAYAANLTIERQVDDLASWLVSL
jgi:type II restriction enzyme